VPLAFATRLSHLRLSGGAQLGEERRRAHAGEAVLDDRGWVVSGVCLPRLVDGGGRQVAQLGDPAARRRGFEDDESEIRRVDPESGEVLARLTMPAGAGVSGLDADGEDLFYAGGGTSGKMRAVRRPHRKRRTPWR
jgi:hypothetical protein